MKLSWRLAQALYLSVEALCLSSLARGKARPAVFIAVLQFIQWFLFGRRVGEFSGMSKLRSFIMSMLFGFTWWLPQNELTHQAIEAQVDESRFSSKASGIRLAQSEQKDKE